MTGSRNAEPQVDNLRYGKRRAGFQPAQNKAQVENLCYGDLCYGDLRYGDLRYGNGSYRIGSVSIGTGGPGAIWAPGGSCSGGIGAP